MVLTVNMGSNMAAKFGAIQTYTAGGVIYRGGLVALRLQAADDKVYAAVDDPTDAYEQLILGFAMEAAVANAAVRVRQDGKFRLDFPSMPASVLGRLACLKADDSVQLWSAGSTCKVVVGRITEKYSTTQVFVNLADRPARLATSLTD